MSQMRKLIFLLVLTAFGHTTFAQDAGHSLFGLDVLNFGGYIARHNPDIAHLITDHPSGILVSMNRKTYGKKLWERVYNYPDWGASYLYQDMKNEFLGEHHGLYAHYNFYLFNRNVVLRTATGLAYNTTPYDRDQNFRNIAYGTHILSSTYLLLNYKKPRLLGALGIEAGLGVVHYSNANIKAPNKSTNTVLVNFGVNYEFDTQEEQPYVPKEKRVAKYNEPLHYNFIFRTGINENDVVGSGQFPFYTFGTYVDKRLNRRSTLQLGGEVFVSRALKEYIKYRAVGNFNDGTTGREDSTRASVFFGHELTLNKFSIITHLAYYVYYPYEFEGRIYNRFGLQYYLNKRLFTSISVRSHIAKAEMAEVTLGYRL